jgi:hypothetical protein
MTCVFFILSVLSIPAYIFYLSGNAIGNELDPKNVKNSLTAISLGNIGQSGYACDYTWQNDGILDFYLSCEFGTLDSIDQIVMAEDEYTVDGNLLN